MKIAVTRPFWDMTKENPHDGDPVAAGTTITVTAERGAELIAAGVGVEAEEAVQPKAAPAAKPA